MLGRQAVYETGSGGGLVFSSSTTSFLFWVYIAALIPRLAVVFVLGHAPLNLDEIEYDRIAWNLSSGLGYTWFFDLPTAYRSPGYPGFLALVYLVFGPDYVIGRAAGASVAALQAPLIAVLGAQTLGDRAGRIAAIVVALYVPIVFYSMALMSENLFYALMLGSLILWVKLLDSRSLGLVALAGVLFGAAVLTRPEYAAFLVLLFLFVLFQRRRYPGLGRRFALMAGVVLLMVGPWVARNYVVTDRLMFLDSRLGINMAISFNERANGGFENPDELMREHIGEMRDVLLPDASYSQFLRILLADRNSYLDRQRREPPFADEALASAPVFDLLLREAGMRRAWSYIHDNPLDALLLAPAKFSTFWSLEQRLYIFAYTNNMLGEFPKPALLLFFVVLLAPFPLLTLLAVADNCLASSLTAKRFVLLLPVAYYSAVHSVIFGDSRFHFVIVPLLALFAGHVLTRREQLAGLLGWNARDDGLRARRLIFYAVSAAFVGVWVWGQLQVASDWRAVFGPNAHLLFRPF